MDFRKWWKKRKYWYMGFIIGFLLSIVIFFGIGFLRNFIAGYEEREFLQTIAFMVAFYIPCSIPGLASGGHPPACVFLGFLMPFVYGIIGAIIGFIIWKVKNKSRKFQKIFWSCTVAILIITIIVLFVIHNKEKIKKIIIDINQPTEKPFKKNIFYNKNEPFIINGDIVMKKVSDIEIILHMDRGGTALSNTEIFINNKSVAHDISHGGYLTFIIAKADVSKGKDNFEIRIHSRIPNEQVFYADFSDSPLNIYKDSKINGNGLDAVYINPIT